MTTNPHAEAVSAAVARPLQPREYEPLAPCPFCGGKPELETRDVEPQGDGWYGRKDETFVLCNCGACLFDGYFHEGFYDAETRAVAAWNKRAAPADLTAALAANEAQAETIARLEAIGAQMYDALRRAAELRNLGYNEYFAEEVAKGNQPSPGKGFARTTTAAATEIEKQVAAAREKWKEALTTGAAK